MDKNSLNRVAETYPMRINPYYMSLIETPGDPIWNQAVPDIRELETAGTGLSDPLCEEQQSPVPGLIHRYPDRAVLLVSSECAVFCRFCMRKRKVGQPFGVNVHTVEAGMAYIKQHDTLREVILSGGDPLLLEDNVLEDILVELRAIPHVRVIRIHTRVPCTLPHRVTDQLTAMLARFHPIYMNTHFNHPKEITPEAEAACHKLTRAGIPLGCQTVLLYGVNDAPGVIKQLMMRLMEIRVRPYYLHHPDPVRGTDHFRMPLSAGLAIMQDLRGSISGMCVPQYMIDLPGGGGKIPLLPEYIEKEENGMLHVRNFMGDLFQYPVG